MTPVLSNPPTPVRSVAARLRAGRAAAGDGDRRRAGRAVAWVAVLVLMVAGTLGVEIAYTLRRDYLGADSAPALPASYGEPSGHTLRLAVLGDSTAVGLGAGAAEETVAGGLARLLAAESGSQVRLVPLGVSGARAADLRAQVDRLERAGGADLAVVLVGANDGTHLTRLSAVRRDVGDSVARLRRAGSQVVVGTCPDLGAVRAFPPPLRTLAAVRGRAVADAQGPAVARAGGVAVDLAALTGPAFRADPATLSADRFHPSAIGYRLWLDALAPAVRSALPRP